MNGAVSEPGLLPAADGRSSPAEILATRTSSLRRLSLLLTLAEGAVGVGSLRGR